MARIFLLAALFALSATSAFADAIDGSWCSKDGKHLSINGPEITLSNDTKIQGSYRRHEFLYVVPQGEADAGSQIYLRLMTEDQMLFYHVKDNQAIDPISWVRCAVPPKTS